MSRSILHLDGKTRVEVMELFQNLNGESLITVILVTHEPEITMYSRRAVRFTDGRITSDGSAQLTAMS